MSRFCSRIIFHVRLTSRRLSPGIHLPSSRIDCCCGLSLGQCLMYVVFARIYAAGGTTPNRDAMQSKAGVVSGVFAVAAAAAVNEAVRMKRKPSERIQMSGRISSRASGKPLIGRSNPRPRKMRNPRSMVLSQQTLIKSSRPQRPTRKPPGFNYAGSRFKEFLPGRNLFRDAIWFCSTSERISREMFLLHTPEATSKV
jgi:hypothetical protein